MVRPGGSAAGPIFLSRLLFGVRAACLAALPPRPGKRLSKERQADAACAERIAVLG
jgi:hypothetical protein